MGGLEVSTVVSSKQGLDDLTDILFFSKLLSQAWPSVEKVTTRVVAFLNEFNSLTESSSIFSIIELKAKYQTRGRFIKIRKDDAMQILDSGDREATLKSARTIYKSTESWTVQTSSRFNLEAVETSEKQSVLNSFKSSLYKFNLL